MAFAAACGLEPTWQQKQLLELVQWETRGGGPPGFVRKGRIACASGQGVGKSLAVVIAGLWRTLQAPRARTIVTAPSMRQCRDIHLTEASQTVEHANPLLRRMIEVTRSRIIIAGDYRWGVWPVTATDPVNFQGYHEPNLTFLVEEASGVDRAIIEQIKGTLTNANALLLLIGNPNTLDCAFYDCFSVQSKLWHLLHFDAEDTARDYGHIPAMGGLAERNRLLAEEYGIESDVYRVRVKGLFPNSDPNCVMAMDDAIACTKVDLYLAAKMKRRIGSQEEVAKQVGIDLARFGSDESVVILRQGNAMIEMRTFTKKEPLQVVEAALKMQVDRGWKPEETRFVIDVGGMGSGVVAFLHRARPNVLEFNNGASATDSKQFANKVTEAHFHVAKLAKSRKARFIADQRMLQQLCTRQYFVNKKGQLILETKEEYKKRGFDSPDRADAAVMAFYDNLVVAGRVSRQ